VAFALQGRGAYLGLVAEDRPLPGYDTTTRWGRFRTYAFDYLWNDHAYLRLGFKNDHWISRAGAHQPAVAAPAGGVEEERRQDGHQPARRVRRQLLRPGEIRLRKLGLKMVDFVITSREVPIKERVLGARDLFETIEYPALMHCKSGADRAGIMSVLYAHFRLGKPIEEAMEQLSFKYLHIKQGKTGVLDYTFERYLTDAAPKGLTFTQWVESPDYDPVKIKADFRAGMIGGIVTEGILKRE
jgi:protein tyrosine phosphatase (PTP) superfamily phosphohydrolase (DUF442 family)